MHSLMWFLIGKLTNPDALILTVKNTLQNI
jgi:hypothetical protein